MTKTVISVLLAALLGIAASSAARADLLVTVERPHRTLDTSAFTTFTVSVVSGFSQEVPVRAIRVVNVLPDADWYSSICSITTCYPQEADTAGPVNVPANGITRFTVHVMTGRVYGDTGRIVLRVDAGTTADASVHELTVATSAPTVQLVRLEPDALYRSVASGDTAEFSVWLYNQSGDTIGVVLDRTEEYFSTPGWRSTLCIDDLCFEPDVESIAERRLDIDRAVRYRLRITAGSGGQARIVLRFTTSRGAEPLELRFEVEAGVSSVEDAEPWRTRTMELR